MDERSAGKVCFTGNIFALYSGIVRLQKTPHKATFTESEIKTEII